MSRTRKRATALVIAAVVSIGTTVTLSSVAARKADEAEAEKAPTSEMFGPAPDAATPPMWLLSDFSWM
jgi:hypothetical protein